MRTLLDATSVIALVSAAVAIPGGTASAQTAPARTTVEPASRGLEEIIVTAQKREANVQNVPMSISALSGATIQKDKIRTLGDLASTVTGISFTANSPQSNEINIRGVVNTRLSSPTADQSVSTFVDDVYVGRSGNLNSAFYDVSRIEILRGPQGVLLGKNVSGGAINVISSPATETTSGHFTASYGNYNEVQTSGYLNGGLGEGLAGRVSFQTINHSGYARDILHNTDLENLDSIQGRAQLVYKAPDSDFTAHLIIDAARDHGDGINRVGIPALAGVRPWSTVRNKLAAILGRPLSVRESLPSWPTFAGDAIASPQSVTHKSFNAILRLEKDVLADVRLSSITGLREGKAYTLYDQSGFAPTNPYNLTSTLLFTEPVNFIEDAHQFSQELRLASTNSADRFEWLVGAYYLRLKVHQVNRFWGETQYQPGPPGVPGVSGALPPGALGTLSGESHWDDTGTSEDKAVFGQIGFKITPTLKFEAGIRYTHDSKRGNQAGFVIARGDRFVPTDTKSLTPLALPVGTDSFTTPYGATWQRVTTQATLTFKPTDGILAYATYSTGFKGGGFQNDAPNAFAATVPYNPETVTNYEAGIKTEFLDHRLRLNTSVFHMKYKNLQVQQTSAACLCNIINNASSASITGIEGELQASPARWFKFWATGSYLDAKYDVFIDTNGVNNTGHFLQRTPHWQASVGAEATTDLGSWQDALTARISYRYQAKMFWAPDNLNVEKGYGLLDARVTFKIPDRDWTISAYGKNLANKLYRTNIIAFFGDEVSSFAAPRTYGVELSVGF